MSKENLLTRAKELEITVPKAATKEQIEDLIKVAEHPILVTELKASKAKITELSLLLKEKPTTKKTPGPTYENEQGKFVFLVESFRFEGKKYTSKEAVNNKALMDALIKSNFKFLKPLK